MSAHVEIPIRLRAAYLAMHRQTNAHLLDLGITADQYVCLDALYGNDRIIQRDLKKGSGFRF